MPAGTFMCEQRCEGATPVLSKVPYVNRMFKNVGYGRVPENVIVLVTPRIVETPTEEVREVKTGKFMMGGCCKSSTGVVGSVCAEACCTACRECNDVDVLSGQERHDEYGRHRCAVLEQRQR